MKAPAPKQFQGYFSPGQTLTVRVPTLGRSQCCAAAGGYTLYGEKTQISPGAILVFLGDHVAKDTGAVATGIVEVSYHEAIWLVPDSYLTPI